MSRRGECISFYRQRCAWHKGFYNDNDPEQSLCDISYTDFFMKPDDVNFAYDDAHSLLRGSCHLFALSLSKVFGYSPYLIETKDGKHFHAFCQVYRENWCYYIDARGATTSFDEFMDVAGDFVTGEFIIRGIDTQDIEKWKIDEDYLKEALLFAETVIKNFEECYRV